ncbi:MAG TPA: hypothetical protein VLU96_04980 [Gaiellaceae bacterium]|nr:hypothetical protein [Gaiellaceae bacterium]
MTRVRVGAVTAIFVLAGVLTLFLVMLAGRSTGPGAAVVPKAGGSEESAAAKAGLGPNSYEAYLQAMRTYPAKSLSPAIVTRAKATFGRIAKADARRIHKGHTFLWDENTWKQYGPRVNGTQPGVTSFSGATNNTASRTTALVADPDCTAHKCRVWAGVSGGGVWMTENILAPDPVWKQLSPEDLDQNSVGTLVLAPGGGKHEYGQKHFSGNNNDGNDTLYLGTGEANRCSSGCEAGVGIYKSTDGGDHWKKLDDTCVDNAVYKCVVPGNDAFLGRGITDIVVDPTNSKHLLVGSAQAVRGLSHVIGAGGTTRNEPGANEPGLYESWNGGKTFTEVWNGAKPDAGVSFGITDVALDPLNPNTVYVAAFDAGVWRRDAGASATSFNQVFAPQFNQGGGIDRASIALTVKNLHTRIYLTEGTANPGNYTNALASNFWRIDNANQPASTLLASQSLPCTPPDPTTHTYPAVYNGWTCLTSQATGNPYFATVDFCTGQCWYDNIVYTPEGQPDTVYVGGSYEYGELPCSTKGVGCGNGRSNGRAVIYSNTAGDPDGTANMRTFTDLTYDAQDNPAPWCAYAPYFPQGCTNAPDAIHPDQHGIVVNPGNPTQIFEASDGGMIRTNGTFADTSAQCDNPYRNGGTPLPTASGSYLTCQRLLSRVPVDLDHIDKNLSSTLQFIGVAINPQKSCEVMAGTQDNGTWSNLNNCNNKTWPQVIYGDGGNAGYDATEPTWRFNEYTGGYSDSNFENGDPEAWVISSAPLVNSGEPFAFYWPQISDPNPLPGTHPIYSGGQHVWRTWAFGAGHAGDVPQDTTPDIAGYEANCPEFVTSGAQPGCGDYRPLGGPYCDGIASTPDPPCANQPGDLTGTVYGTDRAGGSISWIARDGADHGTLWAATGAGRIFVTHNADASDPATVTWHRIDSSTSGNSPTRYPSGIYVDPNHADHAWISYSGYNAVTPTTPGHVFSVWEGPSAVPGSGTFTNLHVESGASAYPTPFSDGDLPVSDVVRDDATHTLYVGTDFGVLRGNNDGASWHVTKGMPRYEVMHLAIQPSNREPTCTGPGHCKRILYAATHSQGIWRMNLSH